MDPTTDKSKAAAGMRPKTLEVGQHFCSFGGVLVHKFSSQHERGKSKLQALVLGGFCTPIKTFKVETAPCFIVLYGAKV